MVGRLITHEILRTWRPLLLVLGVPSLLVLTAVGVVLFDLSWFSDAAFVAGILAVGLASALVQIYLIFDYWRSSHSSAAYLTHSLPVPGARIYWVRLGWGVLVMLAGGLWLVLLALVLVAASSARGTMTFAQSLGQLVGDLGAVARVLSGWGWVLVVVFTVSMTVLSLAQFHFAISIGSESWINRLGAVGPVVVYLVTVTVIQLLAVVSVVAVPIGLAFPDTGGAVAVQRITLTDLMAGTDVMPIGWFLVMTAICVLLVWRTVVSWNSRISLR